jgi:hypothetical protein
MIHGRVGRGGNAGEKSKPHERPAYQFEVHTGPKRGAERRIGLFMCRLNHKGPG